MISRISPGELDQLLIEKVGKSLSQIQKQDAQLRGLQTRTQFAESRAATLQRMYDELRSELRAEQVCLTQVSHACEELRANVVKVSGEKYYAERALSIVQAKLASLEQQLELIRANVSAEALVGVQA